MAFKGERSSCETMARNSSFERLAASAVARATCSCANCSRSASACLRSVMSMIERERLALLVGFQEDASGLLALVGVDRVEPAKPAPPQCLLLGLAGELV